jgi:coenzyme F420 hydrogenase subunit beta
VPSRGLTFPIFFSIPVLRYTPRLMSLVQLRRSGPFVKRFETSFESANQPPRALRSLARIIDDGLCHRCGSCIGICPTQVLGLDQDDYPVVQNLSSCTDCDLCVKVCPGDELSVNEIHQDLFSKPQDLSDVHGSFQKAYLSYAEDPAVRSQSSSGGTVTALLSSLLAQGEIDGAAVITSDPETPWKGKPIIARSVEAIQSGMKSKYAISPTNIVFQEILQIPGRYAIVGLPCQLHGFQKAIRLDRRLRERIVLTVGLFCHAATEHDPVRYIWEQTKRPNKKPVRYLPRVGKHPGTPMVIYDDGSEEPVYFPEKSGYRPSSTEMLNVLYRMFTPERCMTCYDSTSEFSDVSVGDPWMPPPADHINFYDGYSFVMSRTDQGEAMLRKAAEYKSLSLLEVAREPAKVCNRETALEKRFRAFRVMETRKRQGHGVPDYGMKFPKASGFRFLKTEMNMLTHVLCYLPRLQIPMLRFLLSPVGYFLFWLNHQRRVLRVFLRDTFAIQKRKFLKREDLFEKK